MENKTLNIEDLVILYEDNHIIVVLKPQMMPCCPDESGDVDLLSLVKEYIRVTYSKPGNVYVGLVHRLDRPTGGVMVYAKSSKAASRLSEGLKEGDFEKKYLAVLMGRPREDKAVLTHYVKKNAVNNMVYVTPQTTEGAKKAQLEYCVREEVGGCTLAEVTLHTGRSHQIRVQMNAIGCPLYGDMRYGGEKAKKGRLALWAYQLSFTHPTREERMLFKVQPPESAPWQAFDTSFCVQL